MYLWIKINNLETYEYIDLKEKCSNIFSTATRANIVRIGKLAIFNVDSGRCFENINEFFFPSELEYLMPKETVYGVLSTQNGEIYTIIFSSLHFKIYNTDKTAPTYPETLYGQICWFLN